jgi:hypothetical protein
MSLPFIRILVGAAVLASIYGGHTMAQSTAVLEGSWSGSLDVRTPNKLDKLVPLTLTVANVGAGQSAGAIQFGAPKSCTATLQFSGIDADRNFWFRVISSNGGYCLRLQNSDAVMGIRPSEAGSVSLKVMESGIFWGGALDEVPFPTK